jgi:large subunit ribosomal protein L9
MELVLIEDIEGLGLKGEIVEVARGYARNYLLPRKLAAVPSADVVEAVRRNAEKEAAAQEALKADRMEVAKHLAAVHVTIRMKASEEGHLYGSVGPRQVLEALVPEGYELEEKNVHLDPHIKQIGDYDVPIALHPEVVVPIKVTVDTEED